jgi:hypothetical protein
MAFYPELLSKQIVFFWLCSQLTQARPKMQRCPIYRHVYTRTMFHAGIPLHIVIPYPYRIHTVLVSGAIVVSASISDSIATEQVKRGIHAIGLPLVLAHFSLVLGATAIQSATSTTSLLKSGTICWRCFVLLVVEDCAILVSNVYR